MRTRVLITLFLVFFSCKNVTKKDSPKTQIVIDSTALKVEAVEKNSGNLNLSSFLENPIDLQSFKKSKSQRYTTTGVAKGMEYHFHPKIKDSIFYSYYYPIKNFLSAKKIDKVLVFKYGENKHTYDDETEILIGLKVFNKDPDLGKANLIGHTIDELETEFGSDYLKLDNKIIYTNKNKVLILQLDISKVQSYNYLKLSTTQIDIDLIRQILE